MIQKTTEKKLHMKNMMHFNMMDKKSHVMDTGTTEKRFASDLEKKTRLDSAAGGTQREGVYRCEMCDSVDEFQIEESARPK